MLSLQDACAAVDLIDVFASTCAVSCVLMHLCLMRSYVCVMQDACAAAGVTAAPLSCSEAMAQFRQLRLPHSSSCLMQPDGAVLNAADAGAAARQLAEKAGVVSRVSGAAWCS
jgi:hypothetical protein